MRHLYECQMRWADMDLLGHVNNVTYVDYLQEARVDMLRTHGRSSATSGLAEGVVVVRHDVTYRAPVSFRFRPLSIECWVTEVRAGSFTLAHEVFDPVADPSAPSGRQVYLTGSTVLAPYVFDGEHPRRLRPDECASLEAYLEPTEAAPTTPVPAPARGRVNRFSLQTRFSDVDVYGHVSNVKYFEYLQEARILLMNRLWRGLPPVSVVVARTEVDYRAPILFRPEPYDVWSSVERVGRTSMTVVSEIADGDAVLARARVVIVFFDNETQRPTTPAEDYRAAALATLG